MPTRPVVISGEIAGVVTTERIVDSFRDDVPFVIEFNVGICVAAPCALKGMGLELWREHPLRESASSPSVDDQIEFTWGKNVDLEDLYWSMARPIPTWHESLPDG